MSYLIHIIFLQMLLPIVMHSMDKALFLYFWMMLPALEQKPDS